jgi:proteasome accessory factor A
MAIPKVFGIETEYGIATHDDPTTNPVLASSVLIASYAGTLRKIRWDYEQESPLRDARGFDAHAGREGTDEDLGLANVVLPNGARYYVDHAHPEYSTPECISPRQLVIHDKAGERILERSLDAVAREFPAHAPVSIYKNNSDGKGNSYGTHENYLVDRESAFDDIVRHIIPFLVSRIVFCGAGKVGTEVAWPEPAMGYQLTQRADFFETAVGLETTLKRPIVNTRDEPHADPGKYRRLHLICGDANLSEIATFLKIGTTALVLRMLEDGRCPEPALADPVSALHRISRDPTCRATVEMADGRELRALDIQWEYFEHASKYLADGDVEPAPDDDDVLRRWEAVLTGLERDPLQLHRELDWVAKFRLLEAYRDRDGLAWDAPKLHAIDLQYHDVRSDRGLYARLAVQGRMDRITTDAEIDAAVMVPPEDTRAWFRGRCIDRYPDSIAAASWDSLIVELSPGAQLRRIPMLEPLRGTRLHVEGLLEQADDVAKLVDLLEA